MNIALVVALLCFWLFFAYRAFESGDVPKAIMFLIVGAALTLYRLRARPSK
jgi:hypothetical protein